MPVVGVKSSDFPSLPPLGGDEQLLYTEPNVSLYFNPNASEGAGTLFVTTKNVIWLSSTDANKGYSVDFPFISLHATSRDTTHFSHPCLYCQLDVEEEHNEGDDEEGEDGEVDVNQINGEVQYSEMRLVPQDPNTLSAIFDAFSQGAALNPDQENEDEGNFFFNHDEVNSNLERLDGILQMPTAEQFEQQINPDQFEDDNHGDDDGDQMEQ